MVHRFSMDSKKATEGFQRPRFRSLDVFRGATVAFMILVNNPGSWTHMYEPLKHAQWHGCTPTDLVFPFFLFAVGNALAFVFHSLENEKQGVVWSRILKRTILIFAIGLVLNAAPFVQWNGSQQLVLKDWGQLRWLGVLQRIALSFGGAASIIWLWDRGKQVRGILGTAVAILIAYWIACRAWGTPGDPYSLEGFFGTRLDRTLLGEAHLYHGEGVAFDPEGLASTLPGMAHVIFGWWIGRLISQSKLNYELIARLFLLATLFLVFAYVWQLDFPINKKIWTSTFVLFTCGLATMGIACLIYILDVRPMGHDPKLKNANWWASFFEVFGKNPLFLFVLSGLVPRFFSLIRWQSGDGGNGSPKWSTPLTVLQDIFGSVGSDPRLGSLLYSIFLLICYWLIARWLDRRRIYIRV